MKADALPMTDGVESDGRRSALAAIDRRVDRFSEWLNPILIKEARQSLKSKHFAVIFFLVLLCAWAWSFLGMAVGPMAYWRSAGAGMLLGYTWIMLFPLVVVIPFMAFFSLAGERDDGTYELVTITTLRPRQIVAGRLASAVLQMFVYQSVLSPCVAFTYLLRGVDLVLILLLLSYGSCLCLLLTSAALLAATIGRTRFVNLLLAMPLLIGLLGVYFGLGNLVHDLLRFGVRQDYARADFWIAQLVVVTVGGSFFVLFSVATTMMLTFSSQNRSTPLRLVMLAQQMLAVGWGAWYLVGEGNPGGLMVTLILGTLYWGLMGSLLIGESPELHQRARRRLPQSFLSRATLTWLWPGPGTGYVFALANIWTLTAEMLCAVEVARRREFTFHFRPLDDGRILWIAVFASCYLTIYLGAARLIVLSLRRFLPPAPPVGLLITALLVFVGLFAPTAMVASLAAYDYAYSQYEYSLVQLPNLLTTLGEVEQNGVNSPHFIPILYSLGACSMLVVAVNLLFAGREVRRLRESAPQRVLADDAARRPSPPKVARELE